MADKETQETQPPAPPQLISEAERPYTIYGGEIQRLIDKLNALSGAQGVTWNDVNQEISLLHNTVRGRPLKE